MYILPQLTHRLGHLRGELTGAALQLPQRPRERILVHHGGRGGIRGGEQRKVDLRQHLVERLQARSLGQRPVLYVRVQQCRRVHHLLRELLEEVAALGVGAVGG